MKAYIINIKEKTDRWNRMTHLMQSLDIPYERQDGKRWNLPDTKLPYCWLFNRHLTKGEVGCLLSHREVWRKISEGSENVCLVLEDDAVISPDLTDLLRRVERRPELFDLLKFDHSPTCPPSRRVDGKEVFLTSKDTLVDVGGG